jgi:hypothetical protein
LGNTDARKHRQQAASEIFGVLLRAARLRNGSDLVSGPSGKTRQAMCLVEAAQ